MSVFGASTPKTAPRFRSSYPIRRARAERRAAEALTLGLSHVVGQSTHIDPDPIVSRSGTRGNLRHVDFDLSRRPAVSSAAARYTEAESSSLPHHILMVRRDRR